MIISFVHTGLLRGTLGVHAKVEKFRDLNGQGW